MSVKEFVIPLLRELRLCQSVAVCICKVMLYCTIWSYAYARVLLFVSVRLYNIVPLGATPVPECCCMYL